MAPSAFWRNQLRLSRSRVARIGAFAICGALGMTLSASAVLGAAVSSDARSPGSLSVADGERGGTGWTPHWQQESSVLPPSATEIDVACGSSVWAAACDPRSRMATVVAVLNRQGEQGVASLEQVAPFSIDNPLPPPRPVIDAAAEQAATAKAAAEAQAVAAATAEAQAAAADATAPPNAANAEATAVALAVQATVTAREAADATATAAAAAELRSASATATAQAQSLRAAERRQTRAMLIATPEIIAAVSPATGGSAGGKSITLVSLALIPVLLCALTLRLWRRQEPFVLKAKPVEA